MTVKRIPYFTLLIFLFLTPPQLSAQNLVVNGDCENPLVNNLIPGWTIVSGNWIPKTRNIWDDRDYDAQSGQFYFFAGINRVAELSQVIDLSSYSCYTDFGKMSFDFTCYMRSYPQTPPDEANAIVEFLNVNNAVVLTYNTGVFNNTTTWVRVNTRLRAPAGTRRVRIRLISNRRSGQDNDGSFDNISLVPVNNFKNLSIDTIHSKPITCGNPNGEVKVSARGGSGTYIYSVDGRNFLPDSTIRGLNAGSFTLTVLDTNGCTISRPVSVGALPLPEIESITPKTATCGRNDGNIKIVGKSGVGTLSYALGNGVFSTKNTFDSLRAGTYTVSVKDSVGCVVQQTATVGDVPPPVIDSVPMTPTACDRESGVLRVFGKASTGQLTYSLNGASFSPNNVFQNLKQGAYSVSLRDSNGCITSRSVTVTQSLPPVIDLVQVQNTSCGKDNGSLTIIARGGTGSLNYSIKAGSSNASNQFSNLKKGEYTVVVKDANGCTSSKNAIVGEQAAPVIDSAIVKATTCGFENGSITVLAKGGIGQLFYTLNNSSYGRSNEFKNIKGGSYTITVRDSGGCLVNKVVSVPTSQPIEIEAINMTPTECGRSTGKLVVLVKNATANTKYSIRGDEFQANNIFENLSSGDYMVVVKDNNQCQTDTTATVRNDCGVFVPNIFTPNGDGYNDFLTLYGDLALVEKVLVFQIFNRWGNLVFNDPSVTLNDSNSGWNGKARGDNLPTDVYVYYVKVQMRDGSFMERKGDVMLMR